MRTLLLLLIIIQLSFECAAQHKLLGRKIGEIKFTAVKADIELGPEVQTGDGRTVIMYQAKNKKEHSVDIKLINTLYFNLRESDRCYMITSTPSINHRWVADTLIKRLKREGFQQVDLNTLIDSSSNCVASLEYISPIDPQTMKKVKVNILRVTYYLQQL